MAGHGLWNDDDMRDPEICSQVIYHGRDHYKPCPGRAVAWYKVGRDYVSRCDEHHERNSDLVQVPFDEVVTAWVLEA